MIKKPKSQLSEDEKNEILTLYGNGILVKIIAAQFNCSESHVIAISRALGAPKRNRSATTKKCWEDGKTRLLHSANGRARNAVYAKDYENQHAKTRR